MCSAWSYISMIINLRVILFRTHLIHGISLKGVYFSSAQSTVKSFETNFCPPHSPISPRPLNVTHFHVFPAFLHFSVCSSHLRLCLSAICLLVLSLKKHVRAQSRRLQAFPHKQPNLSSWFSACLFWVFLRDDISAGKPNSPERVLSLWGSSRRG